MKSNIEEDSELCSGDSPGQSDLALSIAGGKKVSVAFIPGHYRSETHFLFYKFHSQLQLGRMRNSRLHP